MIEQYVPEFGEEERQAVYEYMGTNAWLTEHDKTRELERMIADFVGAKYCYMTPNCTLALYASLKALGIGPGDEVIVPDFTMIATAFAVEMAGAKPVFVDIDLKTLCIDLKIAQAAITSNTKAMMVVSLNGRAPDMIDAIKLEALSNGLFIIEDAAQAFGSCHYGKRLGTFGVYGCYSFSHPKIITTGQGGCVVTDSGAHADRIRTYRDFGRRQSGGHDHRHIGSNLKFTDLQAVIGIEQMKKISWRVAHKRYVYHLYRELLSGIDEVTLIETDLKEVTPWYVDILVDDRDGLAAFLLDHGIGTREFYPAIHRTYAYMSVPTQSAFPNSVYTANHGLWLPSSLTLQDDEIRQICNTIKRYYTRREIQ